MAKMRDISEYSFFGDVDLERVGNLHRLVGDYRERILGDKFLQDVLLNDSYELEEMERPRTFHAIGDPTIHRMKISIHLGCLEQMIDLVTRPRIVAVRAQSLIIPGRDSEPRVETPEGYDAEKVEAWQGRWLKSRKTRKLVEEYQRILNEAFDEYNLKAILCRMQGCLMREDEVDEPEIHKIYAEIEKTMDGKSYNALDSAYYNMGNRIFMRAGNAWAKLGRDDFGKNFILSTEELAEGFRRMRRG